MSSEARSDHTQAFLMDLAHELEVIYSRLKGETGFPSDDLQEAQNGLRTGGGIARKE